MRARLHVGSPSRIFDHDDYVQEGASPASGVIVLACTIGDDYDDPKNRILVRKDETWLEFRCHGEAVLSIDASADGMAYVLGENGSVIRFDWRAATTDELRASRNLFVNTAAAEIGPLRCIRILGSDVICGGSGGQAYRLAEGQFERLPTLKIGARELQIEDISGAGVTDFVAVTSDGLAASFNGFCWEALDLPTNASPSRIGLSRICSLGDGGYAIAGADATILLGKPGQWSVAEPIDPRRHYWGIAARKGRVYAAYLGGIDVCEGGKIKPLLVPADTGLEFTILRPGPDGIWSFAGKTIGVITDDGWRTIIAESL